MNENIFRQSCLLQLSTSCWTGSKALEPTAMQKLGDSDWLRGKKHLVDPDYLGPVKTTIQKTRKFLGRNALPFPLATLTLVPKESIQKIESGLRELEGEFWNKVDNFIDFYAEARLQAQNVLGELFSDTDYPVNIRDKFRFEWRYVMLDVPKKASILPPEVYEREKEKFITMMDETRELAMLALREEFAGLVSHMVDRLTPAEDGKPKIMRGGMVDHLNEFFASFEERNLFQDEQLKLLVEQAKNVVNEIQSPYVLKYNELLRKRVTDAMTDLKNQVDLAIEDLPRRKIRLPELQEAA